MIDKNKIKWIGGRCKCCGCEPEDLDNYEPLTPELIDDDGYYKAQLSSLLHRYNVLFKFLNSIASIQDFSTRTAFHIHENAKALLKEIGE